MAVVGFRGFALKYNPFSRFLTLTRRLGCGLQILQQLSGINTVMYYSGSIYQMSGFSVSTSIWLAGFTALAQVLGYVASIYAVETRGRRWLTLGSLGVVALSLVGLGLAFLGARLTSGAVTNGDEQCMSQDAAVWDGITRFCGDCVTADGCGYCGGECLVGGTPDDDDADPTKPDTCDGEWVTGTCENPWANLSIVGMVVYLLAFGVGMGGMPWTVNSEIYPLQVRVCERISWRR